MSQITSELQEEKEKPCTFCSIVEKQIRAHIVHVDEEFIAFLDINPIRQGHLQLVPRKHYSYFDDMPPEIAGRMIIVGQKLAKALKNIHKTERVGFVLTGNDIPHVHAHIVPLVGNADITSTAYIEQKDLRFVDAPRAKENELREQANLLRRFLSQ